MMTPRHNGFTLIEMVITVSIVAIVFVIASDFVLQSLGTQRYISEQNEAINQSRLALKTMSAELREAVSADTGAYPLELIADQEIIFYGDIDNDTDTERIRYFLSGETIQRGLIEPTGFPVTYPMENETITTLVSYVRNTPQEPLFYYFDENYPTDIVNNPLTSPVNPVVVRMVEIHVLTNVDTAHIPDTHVLTGRVQLRNLKENF